MTPETQLLIAELRAHYGELFETDEDMLAFIIQRWHVGLTGRALPDGWAFRDELTTRQLKAYFRAMRQLEKADPLDDGDVRSLWEARDIAVRAAYQAGWFAQSPLKGEADIEDLRPATLAAVRNAIEAYYIAQVNVDPT